MSQQDHISYSRLPDPELDAQFYENVSSKRLVAWVIDVLISLVIGSVLTMALAILTFGFGLILFLPILLMSSIIYRTMTIANTSATWGMSFMGIELRNMNGEKFDLAQAAIHSTIFALLMASFVGLIITCFSILTTRRAQGLPDLLLGSTAVNQFAD